MRKLIAVISILVTALAVLTFGLSSPASATLTQPSNGAVLRGNMTLAGTGGVDNSSILGFPHCGGSVRTTLQLINSGGTAVFNQQFNGAGARSVVIDTRTLPNGSYTAREIAGNGANSGFGGLGCTTSNVTTNSAVTIDNITALTVSTPASAPQNTSISVSATLTDGNDTAPLGGRTVTFSLSGGAGTVTGTTNGSGVATATLPVNGPPRSATVTASFAQTTLYKGSSATSPLTVTKNTATTTLAQPANVIFGNSTSFSATVVAANGTSTPSGSVQFTVNGSDFGSPQPLGGGGVATLGGVNSLNVGTYTVGARYLGDVAFEVSNATTKQVIVLKALTSTVLTSSPGSPTVSGQPVTFTATVAVTDGIATLSGAVQFNVDGSPFGTSVPLTGNTAQLTISNLSAGNHQVSATYNGTANIAASTSAEKTHGVNRADTTLQLDTSNSDAVAGEPLTFSADVTVNAPGAGTPTGDVQFFVDGDPLGGPVALVGGSATSPTANLDAGDHEITADYQGDARFAGASDSLEQEIDVAQTTTTVTSSPNPSVFGQPVTIRAEVAPVAPATGVPEGLARFIIDGNTVDFIDLVNGVAEIQVSDLTVGTHTLRAVYFTSDPNFSTSTSANVTQTVNKSASKTTVVTSGSPSVFGQPVTFTASVTALAPGAGNPSGTITFTDGANPLGTVPVSGGQASITVSSLSVAQHAITATYNGDGSFLGSNGSVTQKVNKAHTSTVVTSSANPSQSGQGVTFTATITPVAPGAGDPGGTVKFTVNGLPLGGARPVSGGVATSPQFSSLTPGIYKVVATYSGDGNFLTSSGILEQGAGQNVTKGNTQVGLTSNDPVSAYGQPVTFTATVLALAPANRRPTGVVQFWEGNVLLGATSLEPGATNQGTASFVSSTLNPGAHSIRAVYVGNFNFNGGTASTAQTVEGTPTATGIESSANPITFGQSVTLTAVVSESLPTPGVPTGSVTFREGSNVIGSAPVSTVGGRQVASITVSGLGAGNHVVKATYSGDGTFAGSLSAPFTQGVQRAPSGLEAQVIFRNVGDNGGRVRATLTGLNGAPMAGETLTFDSTSATDGTTLFICTAVTDANGFAQCDATSEILAAILFNSGYDVRWAGNANYLPAQDHQTYFFSG